MGDVNDSLNSPLGLTWALYKRHKQKQKIESIQRDNTLNRGVVEYLPSQIEAFFDPGEVLGNVIVSGGDEFIRLRALARVVDCAYSQHYVPVIIHAGNYKLEKYLTNCFGTTNVSYLNGQFPYYEPFEGLNDSEICHIIMNATTPNFEIKGLGKYYIDGISGFIRSKGIQPYLWMYVTCPHMDLNDKVNQALMNGKISEADARRILSQIVQGELERGNIENFFSKLRSEAEYIIAKKNNLHRSVSIRKTARLRGAVVIDIRSSSNDLLINIIMNELEMLRNSGEHVLLCMDGIQTRDNKMIENYLLSSGNQAIVCMTGSDVYTDFSGNDSLFYKVASMSSKIILSRHLSAFSCQKLSGLAGEYDKQEISDTYTNNLNLIGKFSFGTTSSQNVSIKRESIIKTEDIARLNNDEVYIFDRCNGELAHTQIV